MWLIHKKCQLCQNEFNRFGSRGKVFGWPGALIGFLLFGGSSKYCSGCRAALKAEGKKVDKGPLFRLIWFIVAIIILCSLAG